MRYFDDYDETHALMYTQLHKEFSASLEAAINEWLAYKGLSEEHLEVLCKLSSLFVKPAGETRAATSLNPLMTAVYDQKSWIRGLAERVGLGILLS